MRKSHFNEHSLVLLGPTISSFFACSNEEKNKPKQQSMLALVISMKNICFNAKNGRLWRNVSLPPYRNDVKLIPFISDPNTAMTINGFVIQL
jgi:hypothetical protein